ncbi:hypothetical protein CsSME_00011984 [Camellia sinensis var. sinensis]
MSRDASSAEDSGSRLLVSSELAPSAGSASVKQNSQLELQIPRSTLSVGDQALESEMVER